jgi:hypothetical protein
MPKTLGGHTGPAQKEGSKISNVLDQYMGHIATTPAAGERVKA